MLVSIDGVTKTLSRPKNVGTTETAEWQEMGDVNGTMRPVAAHNLPWHGLVAGAEIRLNGHHYKIISLR